MLYPTRVAGVSDHDHKNTFDQMRHQVLGIPAVARYAGSDTHPSLPTGSHPWLYACRPLRGLEHLSRIWSGEFGTLDMGVICWPALVFYLRSEMSVNSAAASNAGVIFCVAIKATAAGLKPDPKKLNKTWVNSAGCRAKNFFN